MSTATPVLPASLPQMLTMEQVCEFLGVTKTTAYALTSSGRLPSYRIGIKGGAIRVRLSDLEAYLESTRTGTAQPKPPTAPLKLQRLEPGRKRRRKKVGAGA